MPLIANKKSTFIGYVNKLPYNYNHLQPNILMNLFKTNCCSAYNSDLWKFNYKGFDSYCKTWNVTVRRLLKDIGLQF